MKGGNSDSDQKNSRPDRFVGYILCAVGYASCLAKQTQAEILALHVLNVDVLKPHLTNTYSDQFTVGAQGPIAPTALASENVTESKQRIVQTFLIRSSAANCAAASNGSVVTVEGFVGMDY